MKKDKSFEILLEEIASKSPAPGGGSAAALSGAFGASLVSMACNLTIGKKKFESMEDEFKNILDEANTLKEDLLSLSEKDMEAFNEVMAAMKISKDEKEKRNTAIQESYKKAADVPYEVAEKCHRVLELADTTTKKGNKNTITDSGVGALMAYSGLIGAVLNVKVNLKYIEDKDFIEEKEDFLDDLQSTADDLIKSILEEVASSIESD
jgi:formiminotetrahydrofolate cyclodeaminase